MAERRVRAGGYHSFALLLKDGSVLIGGGISPKVDGVEISSIGCERNDVRIYRPAYLTKGPRPVVDVPEPLDLTIGAAGQDDHPVQRRRDPEHRRGRADGARLDDACVRSEPAGSAAHLRGDR